jgi:PAS domain S-box-containing protein
MANRTHRETRKVPETCAGMLAFRQRGSAPITRSQVETRPKDIEVVEMAEGLCVWSCDLRRHQIALSPMCKSLFGFASADEVTPRALREAVHAEDRVAIDRAVYKAIRERSGYQVEFRVIWPDGSLHWVMAVARVSCDSSGIPSRMTGVDMDITEQKRAGEALREAQYHLAEAQQRAHLGTAVRVIAEKKTFWSDEVYRLWGYEPGSVNPSRELLINGIHPEDRSQVYNAMLRAEREGKGDHIIFRVVRPDGSVRILDGQGGVVFGSGGRPEKLFGTAFDITDREVVSAELEESQRKLDESERLFKATFHLAAVGMAHLSLDGHWLQVNQKLCRLVGYSSDELLTKKFDDILHPEDRATDGALLEKLISGELEHFSVEKRCLCKSGDIVWIKTTFALVTGPSGVARYLTAVCEDIGERKRSEAELVGNARLFSTVVEYSPLPIIIETATEPRCLLMLNRRFEELLGYSLKEICRASDFWKQAIPDREARANMMEQMRRRSANSQYPGERRSEPFEARLTRKDGSTVQMEVHAVDVRNLRIVTLIDRSAQQEAQAALIQAEKLSSVARMASSLAHEINNPLTAATYALFLVKSNPALPDSVQWLLELVDQELQRIVQLAKQSFSFYRGKVEFSKVNLPELLDSVLQVFQPKLNNANVKVHRQYGDSTALDGMQGELHQLFANLVVNALDAMSAGGQLWIHVVRTRNWSGGREAYRITIADTGVGIAAADIPRIFQPFFTTNKKEVRTGLGLWTSREIVGRHNGALRLRSQQGRGTVAVVWLPVSRPAALERCA